MTLDGGELDMHVVWTDECLRHVPGGEVWLGVRDQSTEVSAKVDNLPAVNLC